MGLDIIAYSRLERLLNWPAGAEFLEAFVPYSNNGYYLDNRQVMGISPDDVLDFPHHAEHLSTGVYGFTASYSFRAGSYSGYNRWRD